MLGEEYVKRYIEWAKEIYKDRDLKKDSEEGEKALNDFIDKYFESDLIYDHCEILTDHYQDYLRRKRERASWIIKEWTTGEGIFEVDHYIARLPQ